MKITRLLPLAALSLMVACADGITDMPQDQPELEAAAELDEDALPHIYEVTIHNLSDGQPLTPPLAATHDGSVSAFKVGQFASSEIMQLAENGNGAPLQASLMANGGVSEVVATGTPVFPGGSVTFQIGGQDGATNLGWYSMLICTNDGFASHDQFRLPWRVGQTRTALAHAFDAGTEINTEDFADLVPPCPALTGVPSTDPGTGMSNPALYEGRRIVRHRGVQGEDDLVPAIHDWKGPVAQVTVTRLQ